MDSDTRLGLPILSFADAAAFEAWLIEQPQDAAGIWLKLAKKGAGVTGLSKSDAVDAALCHGWIDGQQHPYDAACWLTRFTPRRPNSRWSQVNRTRVADLTQAGRMGPKGLIEVEAARADGRWDAAYAPASTAQVPEDFATALAAAPRAAAAFALLRLSSRYALLYRLATIKRAETRVRRIEAMVAALDEGRDPVAKTRADDPAAS